MGVTKKKQQTENVADETELVAVQKSKRRRRLGWREIRGIDVDFRFVGHWYLSKLGFYVTIRSTTPSRASCLVRV